MYPKSELLFPHDSLADLRDPQDARWDAMIQRATALPESHPDNLALTLMLVYWCQCPTCTMGSYKATLGCSACAQRAVTANRDEDGRWLDEFEAARNEVVAFLQNLEARG